MTQIAPAPSNKKLLLSLFYDHVELAALELEYERQKVWSRLFLFGLGSILFFLALIFLHISLVGALLKTGMAVETIGLFIGGLYLAAAAAIGLSIRKSMVQDEKPFQGTREELTRSLSWIEKLFF